MIITEKKTNAKFRVRDDTYDREVVKECFGLSYFNDKIKYNQNDIVFDVGANIGAFAVRVAPFVQTVHSFEPDSDNYSLAKENLALNNISNVHLHDHALIASDATTIDFFINTKTNKGAHSCLPIRGREKVTIQAKRFSSLVRQLKPTIIKMDIEGAEWDILTANDTDWSSVRSFIFEWHPNVVKDKNFKKLDILEDILRTHFNTVITPKRTKAWNMLIYALKD